MECDAQNESGKIVVGVSGGPDSMALLHLMREWTNPTRLVAVTIDHGFRPGTFLKTRFDDRERRGSGKGASVGFFDAYSTRCEENRLGMCSSIASV